MSSSVSFDDRIAAKFELVEHHRSDMHSYQVEDVEFFRLNPFSYGLIDMGLGKTVTAATLITDLINDFHEGKVLIVGPIAVVTASWPDEFRQWSHLAAHNITLLREDDDDPRLKQARSWARTLGEKESAAETAERVKIRRELARSSTQIHLISFEGLEWLVEFWGRKWPYRTVIVDEASMLKAHDSARFMALAKVRNTPGLITRMHLLTATPAAEGYLALWAPTYLLDLGKRLNKAITHFQNRYFTQNIYTRKWALRPGGEEDLLAKIADICTIRKRKDYFSTKDALIIQRPVALSPRERELYETMQRESVLSLDDETEIEAETAAALSQKLSQIASGVLYETTLRLPEDYDPDIDDETPDLIKGRKVHAIHERKIEALKQIIEELPGKNLLVSYQHRSSLDRLQKAFPKAVKWDKTGKSKAPWNAGKIPMLLMHPKSGGHGQNLQKGGHYVVFFDIPWSREQFVQLIGRVDRQGQSHPVTVILLTTSGTIDETIAKAQREKRDAEEEMIKILRRLVAKHRKSRVLERCP